MKKLIYVIITCLACTAISEEIIHDYTEDWWEQLYPGACSTNSYDSHLDPDGDGWDNWSEARYTAATGKISRPDDASSYPYPSMIFHFRKRTSIDIGSIVVMCYSTVGMDGAPDATYIIPNDSQSVVNATVTQASLGHIRSGETWFFAFIDNNNNGSWDEGEPAGLPTRFPYDVGWDRNELEFTLTDTPVNGFVRFSWPADPLKTTYLVNLQRVTYSGTTNNISTNLTTVFSKLVHAPRTWLHEGDILDGVNTYGGGAPGLDYGGVTSGNPPIPIGPTIQYRFNVDSEVVVDRHTMYYGNGALPTPTPVEPYGGTIQVHPRPVFKWRMSTYASAFELQILSTNSLTPVYTSGIMAAPPPIDGQDLRVWSPPIHWGDTINDGTLDAPMYRWRVRAIQPRDPLGGFVPSPSNYSTPAYIRNALADTAGIQVQLVDGLVYPGSIIRIHAYSTAAFNDMACASIAIPTTDLNLPHTVTLRGLVSGAPYYIAAYIDQNNNNKRDIWESWGYYSATNAASKGVSPRAYDCQPLATLARPSPHNAPIYIMSVDSDNDGQPDTYEYFVNGNLGSPYWPLP